MKKQLESALAFIGKELKAYKKKIEMNEEELEAATKLLKENGDVEDDRCSLFQKLDILHYREEVLQSDLEDLKFIEEVLKNQILEEEEDGKQN